MTDPVGVCVEVELWIYKKTKAASRIFLFSYQKEEEEKKNLVYFIWPFKGTRRQKPIGKLRTKRKKKAILETFSHFPYTERERVH